MCTVTEYSDRVTEYSDRVTEHSNQPVHLGWSLLKLSRDVDSEARPQIQLRHTQIFHHFRDFVESSDHSAAQYVQFTTHRSMYKYTT